MPASQNANPGTIIRFRHGPQGVIYTPRPQDRTYMLPLLCPSQDVFHLNVLIVFVVRQHIGLDHGRVVSGLG